MKWLKKWRLKIGILIFLATLSASRMRDSSAPKLLIIAEDANLSAFTALAQSVGFNSMSLSLKSSLKDKINQYKNVALITDFAHTSAIQQSALGHIWPHITFIDTEQHRQVNYTDTYQLKIIQRQLNRLYNNITKDSQRTPPLPLIFSTQYIKARKKLGNSLIKSDIMQLKRQKTA